MKILISSYTGLGNFILKTPMISTIRDEYPSAIIDIITANGLGIEPILKKNSLINDIIVLNNKASLIEKIIFFMRLRKSKYDLVLLPFDSQPLFLIFGSYISNIKKRVMHLLMHDKKKSMYEALIHFYKYGFVIFKKVPTKNNFIEVFTKNGLLIIKKLQKDNSKAVSAADFINATDLKGKKFE